VHEIPYAREKELKIIIGNFSVNNLTITVIRITQNFKKYWNQKYITYPYQIESGLKPLLIKHLMSDHYRVH